MKKISLFMLTACAVIGFPACNNNDQKKEPVNPPDSLVNNPGAIKKLNLDKNWQGTGNVLIKEKEGDTMRNIYRALYENSSPEGKYLLDSVWVDKVVITSLAEKLESNTEFDGVRFLNGAKKAKYKCQLFLVPTTTRPVAIPGLSDHVNEWTNITIPTGSKPVFQDFGQGHKKTTERKWIFKALYRKGDTEIKCLSSSVWFDRRIIYSLRDLIEDEGNNLDGVEVLFAAYSDNRYSIPGRNAIKQSTIIVVPTHPDGARHVKDWDIIKSKSNYNDKDAYNHGELCPQKCDSVEVLIKK